jgi:acetamidase/formamidase
MVRRLALRHACDCDEAAAGVSSLRRLGGGRPEDAHRMHTLHDHQGHLGWNRATPPVLTIAPGDSVEFHPLDASGGQITARSTVADLARLDFARVNPVVGPVFIDGAQPGDAIKATLLSFSPSGWGWTANIPGFGLLADQFREPALHVWSYAADAQTPAMYGPGGRVPLKPFCGTIGLAPAAPGPHGIVPPRRVGGNMDIRDLCADTELYLPVEVAGALFSVGDTHAAQGDGEVCGTAIESPMSLRIRFDLVRDAGLAFPRFVTAGPVSRHLDAKGYDVTTGIGPDLMQCARDAVSGMIDLVAARHHMSAIDAYLLCSVCADLRISEIVDQPNWVVSLYFPRIVLE